MRNRAAVYWRGVQDKTAGSDDISQELTGDETIWDDMGTPVSGAVQDKNMRGNCHISGGERPVWGRNCLPVQRRTTLTSPRWRKANGPCCRRLTTVIVIKAQTTNKICNNNYNYRSFNGRIFHMTRVRPNRYDFKRLVNTCKKSTTSYTLSLPNGRSKRQFTVLL